MLYQVKRAIVSPASQEVIVDVDEVLTTGAFTVLKDRLGIDHVVCELWLPWEHGVLPHQVRNLPIVGSDNMNDRVTLDIALLY